MSRYGLSKAHTKRTSREFMDFDYIHKLNKEEFEWLSKFSAEYLQNSFSKTDALHSTKEMKRKVYALDNARRRDIWSTQYRVNTDAVDFLLGAEADGRE